MYFCITFKDVEWKTSVSYLWCQFDLKRCIVSTVNQIVSRGPVKILLGFYLQITVKSQTNGNLDGLRLLVLDLSDPDLVRPLFSVPRQKVTDPVGVTRYVRNDVIFLGQRYVHTPLRILYLAPSPPLLNAGTDGDDNEDDVGKATPDLTPTD
ncbi:unnamed protein product [Euphydryas editha]|uniref:Uncharacterized protein n=1 Tax=Euphydryas editha TaxID=104508 RepID=A0AAU9TVX6_EUPED|nr:unnamed protein product [Euphydryas editha]